MSLFKRKYVIIFSCLSLFFIIICATGYGIWRYKKSEMNAPYKLSNLAQKYMESRKYEQARQCIAKALTYRPDDTGFLWSMSIIYKQLKLADEAQKYALKAWSSGKKEREVFFFLVAGCGLDKLEDKMSYGDKLLEGVADEHFVNELRADMMVPLKQYKEALVIYQSLYELRPDVKLASRIAGAFMAMNKNSEALSFLKDAKDKNGLNEKGYISLSNLMVYENPNVQLKPLFEHAQESGEYGPDLQFQHGILSTILGEPVQGNRVLSAMLNNDDEKPMDLIEERRLRKVRLLLALNAYFLKDKLALNNLKDSSVGDDASTEGERLLYQALLESLDGLSLKALSNSLDLIKKLLPNEFVMKLLIARLDTVRGKPLKALEFYASLKNPLFQLWPQIVTDSVAALRKSGDPDNALAVLASYHKKRGAFSLDTALLHRDILLDLDQGDAALEVQDIIQKTFPSNLKLRYQGAFMSIKNGDVKRGLAELKKMVEENPGNERICWSYAASLLRYTGPEQALEYIHTLAKTGRYSALEAGAFLELGDKKKAEEIYKDAIKMFSNEVLYRGYSSFLSREKRIDEAFEIWSNSAVLFPKSIWPLLNLAVYTTDKGNYEQALAFADKAFKLKPKSLDVAGVLARIYMKLGMFEKSLENCNLVLNKNPDAIEMISIKAISLAATHDYSKAVSLLEVAVDKHPNNIILGITYVRSLMALKKWTRAVEVSTRLYSVFPENTQVILYHSTALRSLGEIERSFDVIDKGVNVLSHKDYILNKASLLVMLNDIDAAFIVLRSADSDPDIQRSLLYLELQHGDYEKALKESDKIQLTLLDWTVLGAGAQKKQNFSRAATYYKKALEINDNLPALLNNYAWNAWKASGQVNDEMLESARKATSIMSDNYAVLDTYAQLLLDAGKYESCIEALRLQASNRSANPKLLYWLGMAYEKSNQGVRAAKVYEGAIKRQKQLGEWVLSVDEAMLKEKIDFLIN